MNSKLIMIILFISSKSFAQTITVEKVKGDRAIVKINQGTTYVGQKFTSSAGGETTSVSPMRRLHALTGNFSFSQPSLSINNGSVSSNSLTPKSTAFNLGYHYNQSQAEYGVELLIQNYDYGTTTGSVLNINPFFQYNIKENTPNEEIVPYARGHLLFPSQSSGGISISGFGFKIGGGLLHFPFKHLFALDYNISYSVTNISVKFNSATLSGTLNELALNCGWLVYF